ncbi:response regulator transcription factor [Caulobacter sp. 17J65-9]|uniref:response regulator transcription factor n=1 Tax=Caulobacter sp. 17J65-9 TaxID=2709382 RepID=UPI0013C7F009|nr:response regulator transcription factor [Caulobacter sp. 17J65-9]NEX92608.1 response regulator transcription factor [Caulobacter sp. 17J65-9]
MSSRILVIEDDADTADHILKGLREEGLTVEHAAEGGDGLYLATTGKFDAVVLDRMLPGLDGLSVLKAMRAAEIHTPVLILSALSHLDERVKGLRAGGDDYLIKPFAYSELSARLQSLLRRRSGAAPATVLTCGDLTMDLLSRRVTRGERTLDLLPREFKLLEHLLRNKDRVVTRTMLLEQVFDYRFDPHTGLIDTHVSRLRKKIDEGFDKPLLRTLRGTGYRLSDKA